MRTFVLWLISLATNSCATGGQLPSIHPGDAGFAISGDIESQSKPLLEYIHRQEARGSALTIEINSDGGSAFEGLAIYDAIKSAKVPSVCLVNGHAASAAFLALQACTSRRMTHESKLATHRPMVVIPEPVILTTEAARAMADRIGNLTYMWDSLIAKRMDMPLPEYSKRVADGDVWIMDSDEAIDANAVDVVVDGAPNPLSVSPELTGPAVPTP